MVREISIYIYIYVYTYIYTYIPICMYINSFERVEEFKYMGTILTNQNSFSEEIKSRLLS